MLCHFNINFRLTPKLALLSIHQLALDLFQRLALGLRQFEEVEHKSCQQLLDTTDSSVKEVAARLGYEDPLYFSRVFRTVNDRTPTEYRKLRKG